MYKYVLCAKYVPCAVYILCAEYDFCAATQLLESCVSNCGKDFQLELTKPAFHVQVKEIMTSVSSKILCMYTSVRK